MTKIALLVLLPFALAGCEDGITSDAQPIVSVLKQDGSCFARIAGEPIDVTLGVSGTCPYRGDSRLIASIDMLEVVVDYGADVPFSGTTTAPRPDILVTVDGVASDVAIEVSDEFRVGDRAYFIATFRAPVETSSDIRISAGVNAGFQTIVPEVLTSIQPSVALNLLECPPGTLCKITGAVGSAHITIAVPGDVPQLVTIHSYLDGVPQADPIPPVRTFPANGRTEAITAVPVPAAPDDTTWRLTAQLAGGPVAEASSVIIAPMLESRLTCGSTCSLASGDPVGLEILAPSQIRPLEAFVTTRLDGNPQLVGVRVPLEQRADGTALGLLGLTAPAASGSWQIDVTVAGYTAPTVVTTVQ
jgi:hypothetical protein